MRKTLALVITLVLSACGGNDNNSPAPANTTPATTPANNQNIQPSNPTITTPSATPSATPSTTPTPTLTPGSISGQTLHGRNGGSGRSDDYREVSRNNVSSDNLNTLHINGQDYQIKVPDMETDEMGLLNQMDNLLTTPKSKFTMRMVIPNLRYSNAGILTVGRDFNSTNGNYYVNSHLFHQGITPNTLPSGQARYEGNAYLFSHGLGADRRLFDTKAAAHFDVDFAAKTINGRLDNKVQLDYYDRNSIQDGFSFSGTIQGNQFNATQDKIFYSGGFYGPNAEELSGFMRHEEDKVKGIFNGNKQ